MRTYILNDHDRASIARLPLRVSAATQARSDSVVLTSRCGELTDPSAIRPAPLLMILPTVAERTLIRVEPRNGLGVFPEGTVVSITLQTDALGADVDTVHIHAVDVSGLTHRDLAAVDVESDRRLGVSALNAVEDVVLPELAAAARGEARAALEVDRVPDGYAVNLVIGIDTSASMAPAIAEGSVGAVLDVMTGLSHVIGWNKRFDVCLLADRPRWLPDVTADELASTATREIVAVGLGCGFRSTPPELMHPHGQRTVTYVVTDGPPPDHDELAAVHRGDGDVRHVVMIGGSGRTGPQDLPRTRLDPPPPGSPAVGYLLGSRRVLAELVTSLLAGCFPAGSEAAGRPSR